MAKKSETAAEIRARLDAEEREAFVEFERKQKEKREKALAEVLEPLREKRNALAQSVNEANTRIAELDREISSITGEKQRERKGGGKRAPKRNKEQKLAIAAKLQARMAKSSKNRFAASDLAELADGVPIPELVKLWNESGKPAGEKIHAEGEQRSRRYYVV